MLGPSFSPSITRIPGPISSHSSHAFPRSPCAIRAASTRERSCARSMSSCVTTTASATVTCVATRDLSPFCVPTLILARL